MMKLYHRFIGKEDIYQGFSVFGTIVILGRIIFLWDTVPCAVG